MISQLRDVFRLFYEQTGSNLVEIVVERGVFDALAADFERSAFWDEPSETPEARCYVDGVRVRCAR